MIEKYKTGNTLLCRETRSEKWWKDICKSLNVTKKIADILHKEVLKEVGNSAALRFMIDPWVTDQPSEDKFQRLFSSSLNPQATMGFLDGIQWIGGIFFMGGTTNK